MNSDIFISLVLVLLQMPLRKCQSRYCQEAVDSVEIVESCPTSKTEWDNASERKNCNNIALQQNCEDSQKFQYHCVINGLRDTLIEVCAPTRLIFGHCVEFNVRGGVIQDQKSAPCSKKTFPKCDDFYYSSDAYKYPDCYMLVPKSQAMSSTKYDITTLRTSTGSLSSETIGIVAALLILILISIAIVFLVLKTRQQPTRNKTDESEEAMLKGHYIEQGEGKMVQKRELKTELKSQLHNMNSILRRCFSMDDYSTCNSEIHQTNSVLRRHFSMCELSTNNNKNEENRTEKLEELKTKSKFYIMTECSVDELQ